MDIYNAREGPDGTWAYTPDTGGGPDLGGCAGWALAMFFFTLVACLVAEAVLR